jgi:hypothetical protein
MANRFIFAASTALGLISLATLPVVGQVTESVAI